MNALTSMQETKNDFFNDYDNNKDFYDDMANNNNNNDNRENDNNEFRSRGEGSTTRRRSSPYGNSNGHDYERGPNDNGNVNVDQVNTLLSDRLQARKSGDFVTADRIRDQLSDQHSVTVYDKDKVWEVTNRRQTSNNGRGGGGRGGGRGQGRGGRDGGGRGGRGVGDRAQRKRSNFGPNGHDYELSPEAGPSVVTMSEGEIHVKIAERLMAKMNRDFETADRVQLVLSEEGVYINDRTKAWRADGVCFIDPSEGRMTRNNYANYSNEQPTSKINRDQNRPYVQSEHSSPFLKQHEDGRFDPIQKLVQSRVAMKKQRQYAEADEVRDTLQRDFNVLCDDRIREWSMGGSFGDRNDLKRVQDDAIKSRGYIRSQFSLDLTDDDKHTIDDIQAKVNQRTGAKENRRYTESDALRDELQNDYNVVVQDKIKMWSIGGDFGSDDPKKARELALRTYVRRGGGDLTEEQLQEIQKLLVERVDAKKIRDFVNSDKIRTYLYDTYNINISDPDREWRVLEPDNGVCGYVQAPNAPGATRILTTDEITTVEKLLVERISFKKQRSYEEADNIRDNLEQTYGVVIHDKRKEWNIIRTSNDGDVYNNRNSNTRTTANARPTASASANANRYASPVSSVEENDNDNSKDVETNDKAVPIQETVIATLESAVPSESSSLSREDLTTLTVPLLKEKLREAGKPVSGKKIELIDRLLL
eukprot:CAMPEP_0197833634 /NCGR_PEP_ID=MMETSP1437-20131217/19648_1 /TAXON_ID=49252 ORGANISM="Eucampia antarctica, Strain CCMP1452" /NCGR_SAMPLE_ID=MMETSP1437 /ASSEMBLY_ACC=CAM_ASM_001096 /LENGTH=702 /DNA_ID=CAMNT_0043437809 /DNA_START=156 /DNA_END=2264 /DNA_ORIENTATION=+